MSISFGDREGVLMFYIKNAKIVLEQGILWDGVLAVEGDRIAAFGRAEEISIPDKRDEIYETIDYAMQKADIILVMKDGHILEQGSHEELLKKEGFYSELYNSQFAV